jgi:hypothetical protein
MDRSKAINSSQSIDLTDEDEGPQATVPALVAIHRSNPLLARAIRSPQQPPQVRTPEMINRGIPGRCKNFVIDLIL